MVRWAVACGPVAVSHCHRVVPLHKSNVRIIGLLEAVCGALAWCSAWCV